MLRHSFTVSCSPPHPPIGPLINDCQTQENQRTRETDFPESSPHIGDKGSWQTAAIHQSQSFSRPAGVARLPASGIDFRLTGDVFTSEDVGRCVCLPCPVTCVTDVTSAAPLVVRGRSILLLMKPLTGNKLKLRSPLWKCIIDWAINVVHLRER